jgi:hypothetical protein
MIIVLPFLYYGCETWSVDYYTILKLSRLFTLKLHCPHPFAPLFNAEILFRASLIPEDLHSAGVC